MIDVVVKIGSMALIQKEEHALDYNIFERLSRELRPGMVLVTSGATEIGRLDFITRNGRELSSEDVEQNKTDYAAQGQSILMSTYRSFVKPEYSLRQVLVEHTHFNDAQKREHIRKLLLRAPEQAAIPIINYNDPVSDEENRKMELMSRRQNGGEVVECVDNDETAAVVAALVGAKTLVLLTSTEGIYLNREDPSTLVRDVVLPDATQLSQRVTELMGHCQGASRQGANGARAKLAFALKAALAGTTVIIGSAKYHVSALLSGQAPCTRIGLDA